MGRGLATIVLALASTMTLTPARADALEAHVSEIRTIGPTVRASLEMRQAFTDKFRQILQSGGALHVRVQTEIWEDRPLWDRLVRPALVSVFKIVRDPTSSELAISDAFGKAFSIAAYPDVLSLQIDVVAADAVTDSSRYYLRLVATIGTIAERDIEDTGNAVFGKDEGNLSLGKVGKFLFHTVLQVSDYLQSVTAEAKSRVFHGRDLRPGVR
jgi:hypothetical protein